MPCLMGRTTMFLKQLQSCQEKINPLVFSAQLFKYAVCLFSFEITTSKSVSIPSFFLSSGNKTKIELLVSIWTSCYRLRWQCLLLYVQYSVISLKCRPPSFRFYFCIPFPLYLHFRSNMTRLLKQCIPVLSFQLNKALAKDIVCFRTKLCSFCSLLSSVLIKMVQLILSKNWSNTSQIILSWNLLKFVPLHGGVLSDLAITLL